MDVTSLRDRAKELDFHLEKSIEAVFSQAYPLFERRRKCDRNPFDTLLLLGIAFVACTGARRQRWPPPR